MDKPLKKGILKNKLNFPFYFKFLEHPSTAGVIFEGSSVFYQTPKHRSKKFHKPISKLI